MAKILIVEDDDAMREAVGLGLKSNGFEVCAVANGLDVIPAMEKHQPDLVLLDIQLPGRNGIDVCRDIREFSMIPIIILSAKSEEEDMIEGLKAGADDYETKPYPLPVLAMKIEKRLKTSNIQTTEKLIVNIGDVVMDTRSHEVRKGEKKISLTPLEFKLLYILAANPNKVFTREQLLEQVWEYTYKADTRLVNVHVQRLRSKIEDDPENPKLVLTVRGWGYKAGPE